MPPPPKPKSGTGLKILWIPGRKKHNHDKGVFRPTNYKVEHKHADRKNEPWSLGGSKSQDEILSDGDKDDKLDILRSSTPSSVVLPGASLGVAAVDDCSESGSEIKLEKCVIKDIKVYNIRDSLQSLTSAKSKSTGDGVKRSAEHNATHDLDSIECLDDLDGAPKLQNGSKPQTKCAKKKEEKTVKCLYYTMMCCECTIS